MLDASTSRPAKPARRERAQQHGGAEVVVADVVRDVADVGAEAHHRRLVADRGGAGDGPRGRGGIADVALDPLRARVEVVRPLAVRGRQQAVEDAHLVAALEQRVDDVGADEAGAAGDEDQAAHGATVPTSVLRNGLGCVGGVGLT